MKRLATAPNLAIATLWSDMLTQAGFHATVQRAFTSSIAGEIPPDQALPEIWLLDDSQHGAATAWLQTLRHAPQRNWLCAGCGERVEGAFDSCWNCGAWRPQ